MGPACLGPACLDELQSHGWFSRSPADQRCQPALSSSLALCLPQGGHGQHRGAVACAVPHPPAHWRGHGVGRSAAHPHLQPAGAHHWLLGACLFGGERVQHVTPLRELDSFDSSWRVRAEPVERAQPPSPTHSRPSPLQFAYACGYGEMRVAVREGARTGASAGGTKGGAKGRARTGDCVTSAPRLPAGSGSLTARPSLSRSKTSTKSFCSLTRRHNRWNLPYCGDRDQGTDP